MARSSLPLRACLLALAVVLSQLALPAAAQDPRGIAAQRIAREWLTLIDHGEGQASWEQAGKRFQGAMTTAAWVDALRTVRNPLGAVVQRTLEATQFSPWPGGPEGDFALLVFRTSFAVRSDAQESVTLERESDGRWRVVGYFIR